LGPGSLTDQNQTVPLASASQGGFLEEYIWMDRIGSIQAGIDLLNGLGWNINIIQHESSWFVRSGESPSSMPTTEPL